MASCWLMVEPPATAWPFLVLLDRLLDAVPVEAFMIEEAIVFGRHHGALEVPEIFS